ncbi:unnamed protein product, partial [Rotaria magnacalcarata]
STTSPVLSRKDRSKTISSSSSSTYSNLIQQENSLKEKASIWKKPPNGHHPHVAYIDEDDECSVSLKSSTCGSTTATSSSTTSPVSSRKSFE